MTWITRIVYQYRRCDERKKNRILYIFLRKITAIQPDRGFVR